jgi:hypothetical protein
LSVTFCFFVEGATMLFLLMLCYHTDRLAMSLAGLPMEEMKAMFGAFWPSI